MDVHPLLLVMNWVMNTNWNYLKFLFLTDWIL